jgi:hypothetical protein
VSNRVPKPEQVLIAEQVIESLARRYSSRPGLGDAVYEHLLDLGQRLVFEGDDTGTKRKEPLFTRWAWDMDTPLGKYLAIQLRWAFWHATKAQRQQRDALDMDRFADQADDQEQHDAEQDRAGREDARAERLLELADQQRSVAIFLALAAHEKASSVVQRYPGRRGTGRMSYEDLWASETEGRARVTADPELRRLSGLAPDRGLEAAAALAGWARGVAAATFWAPRDLTQLELAVLEVPRSNHHFRPDSCERRTPCRPRSGRHPAPPACRDLRPHRAEGAGFYCGRASAQPGLISQACRVRPPGPLPPHQRTERTPPRACAPAGRRTLPPRAVPPYRPVAIPLERWGPWASARAAPS